MKTRRKELGDRNLIGKNVTMLRKKYEMNQIELMVKLQVEDVNINYSSLSKLEGQTRSATDKELVALAKIFNVDISDLIFKNYEN